MDPQVIAAVIGAAAVIVAAFIGLRKRKQPQHVASPDAYKLALALFELRWLASGRDLPYDEYSPERVNAYFSSQIEALPVPAQRSFSFGSGVASAGIGSLTFYSAFKSERQGDPRIQSFLEIARKSLQSAQGDWRFLFGRTRSSGLRQLRNLIEQLDRSKQPLSVDEVMNQARQISDQVLHELEKLCQAT